MKGRNWLIGVFLSCFLLDVVLTFRDWAVTKHLELNYLYQVTGSMWPVLLANLVFLWVLVFVYPKSKSFGRFNIIYAVAWLTVGRLYAFYSAVHNILVGVSVEEAVAMAPAVAAQASASMLPMFLGLFIVLMVAWFTWWVFKKDHVITSRL